MFACCNYQRIRILVEVERKHPFIFCIDCWRCLAVVFGSVVSPEEWVFGIARNNIRLEIRRRASRGSIDGDISSYLEVIDSEPLPEEVLERQETAEIVRAALGKLKSKEQEVLKAKYIEGLPARRIAERIGVTEKAVHSLLYRARNSLAQQLKQIAPLYKEEQEQ